MLPLRPCVVIGTRPEAIKLAPVLEECRRRGGAIEPLVCLTGQHRELLLPVIDYFGIRADFSLDVMRADQSLAALTARLLEGLDDVLQQCQPDCIVAQGDTTSVLAAGLAAFYRRLPLVHVEAGLRSGSLNAPWPEEFNRRVASIVATLHCAPTAGAANNLESAGIDADSIRITGNTVVDALQATLRREHGRSAFWEARHSIWKNQRMVLITCHRRENLGDALENICRAIAELAGRFPQVAFVWPVHLNPQVRLATATLSDRDNLHLLPPASYPEFVWLLDRATLVLTDSGGVQEEAPSLGKPVLVLRETTERPEAVQSGVAELIGTDGDAIIARVTSLLHNPVELQRLRPTQNPFGDGHASRRIVDWMLERIPAASRTRRVA